jgi:signal transduction histidine kinase
VLSAGQVRRHPPEVEAAVYFCCTEALQNAAKHAPGASVRVHLDEDDDELRFEVVDDGPGLPDDADAPIDGVVRPGQGLGNMVDRVGAVGGSIELVRPEHGGVAVRGRVPVGRRAQEVGA